ncbi:unnamed protein product [Durusdinium trenchii]|uniref:Uncharacterized protein n=1 Tax=Durusdinium trenchii TaxID=1381693 RepID=A0ABP0SX65_9DINO
MRLVGVKPGYSQRAIPEHAYGVSEFAAVRAGTAQAGEPWRFVSFAGQAKPGQISAVPQAVAQAVPQAMRAPRTSGPVQAVAQAVPAGGSARLPRGPWIPAKR